LVIFRATTWTVYADAKFPQLDGPVEVPLGRPLRLLS